MISVCQDLRATIGTARPHASVWVASVLYAAGPVLAKVADVDGPVFAFWRLWIGVPVLAAAVVAHRWLGRGYLTRRGLVVALLAGGALGVQQLCFMSAINRTTAATVMVVSALGPLLLVLAVSAAMGRRAGARFVFWSAVAAAGTIVTVSDTAAGTAGRSVSGLVLACAGVVAFTAFLMLSRAGRGRIDVPAFLLITISTASLVASAFATVAAQPIASVSGRDLLLAAAVAIGPGGLAHALMTWPLDRLPVNVPLAVRLVQPAVTAALAWVWLDEALTGREIGGGVMTLLALGMALAASARSLPGSSTAVQAKNRPWRSRRSRVTSRSQLPLISLKMCARRSANRCSALVVIWLRGRGRSTSMISCSTQGGPPSTMTRSAR